MRPVFFPLSRQNLPSFAKENGRCCCHNCHHNTNYDSGVEAALLDGCWQSYNAATRHVTDQKQGRNKPAHSVILDELAVNHLAVIWVVFVGRGSGGRALFNVFFHIAVPGWEVRFAENLRLKIFGILRRRFWGEVNDFLGRFLKRSKTFKGFLRKIKDF